METDPVRYLYWFRRQLTILMMAKGYRKPIHL